jgi:hypothetical protein
MPNIGVLDSSASINEAMDGVPDVGSPDDVKTNLGAEPDAVVLLLVHGEDAGHSGAGRHTHTWEICVIQRGQGKCRI